MAPPNVAFKPPGDGRYMIPTFLPNRPIGGLIKFTEPDRQGLFQVSVVWNLQDGLVRPTAYAQLVMEHFRRGSVIVRNDGPAVRIIEDPWQAGVDNEPNRMMIPVTIPWIVYA